MTRTQAAAALTALSLVLGAPARTIAAAPTAAQAAPLKTLAQGAVPRDYELAHPILALDLGALGPAAVVLWRKDEMSTYGGAVAMALSGAAPRVALLPPVYEAEGRFEMQVRSVFTIDDAAGKKALVVLYSYYISGTGQPEDYAGYVYAWNGRAWIIDEPRTRRLPGVRTAKAARAKLAR